MQLVQLVVTVVGVVVSIKWFIHQRKNSELQIEQPKINKLVSYMDKLKDYLTHVRIDHSKYQAYELNLEKWIPTDISVDFNNYEREAKDRYRVFTEYLAKYRKKDDWETITSEYNKYCEEFDNYRCRKEGISLYGEWSYIGIQIFDQFINQLKADLDEIDKIITEMDNLINKLIDILDDLSARLKKDYRL
jgi:hypothetical protein